MITEKDFFEILEGHDWHYARSSDHNTFVSGDRQYKQIRNIIREQPELQTLYHNYRKHVFYDGEKPTIMRR